MKTGLDVLLDSGFAPLRRRSVALLCNPASLDAGFQSAADLFADASRRGVFRLTRLFGPQQGIFETQQANMVEWEGSAENRWGVPVVSLYGKTRTPTPAMLSGTECLVVDLQDVGAKGYTFLSTLHHVMAACEKSGVEVIVLDRPNPLGGAVEGPVTRPEFLSFVGVHPFPLRHGLTMGEVATLFRHEIFPRTRLTVVRLEGWKRDQLFPDLGRPWTPTSPNMPTFDTVLVYPGMELLEGTTLSEGRGTTRPFEQFGAPFVSADRLCHELNAAGVEGAFFRPVSFTPTFDKWQGRPCYGAFIHVTDPKVYSSVRCTLEILRAVRALSLDSFRFIDPPYEYETEKLPFDILAGNDYVRHALVESQPIRQLEKKWEPELKEYLRRIEGIQLYP